MNNNDQENNIRRTNDLQSLSQTLLPLTKSILGKNGFVETNIIRCWTEIIGEQLAQYTAPQKIDFPKNQKSNGRLHLAVPSGAFAVEIQHREKYILDKINTFFGYKAVSSLKIIQNSEWQLSSRDNGNSGLLKQAFLSLEETEDIKKASNEIKNQNLKEILIKLGHSVYADNHNIKEAKK